jgi:hypothetical protein
MWSMTGGLLTVNITSVIRLFTQFDVKSVGQSDFWLSFSGDY